MQHGQILKGTLGKSKDDLLLSTYSTSIISVVKPNNFTLKWPKKVVAWQVPQERADKHLKSAISQRLLNTGGTL